MGITAIQHNMLAANAARQFKNTDLRKAKVTEKLASGFRINRAADDAAGLAISEKMRRQVRGLNQGARNIVEGINLLKVADGALSEVNDMLHRITELSVQAANATNNREDRLYIQQEIDEITLEIDRIGRTTTYNEKKIFDDYNGTDESSITTVVSCISADRGYLSEAVHTSNGWLPAANIDFSGINADTLSLLNGKGFAFSCCRGCEETFDFVFKTDGDGTKSSATNLDGKVTHYYTIDISDCTNGSQVVDRIYDFVKTHQPTTGKDTVNELSGALAVSHSNFMMKGDDPNVLTIYASRRIAASNSFVSDGYATKEEAMNAYPSPIAGVNPWAGAIDASRLNIIVEEDLKNEIPIQCSSDVNDVDIIWTRRMNAVILRINGISVTTESGARDGISSTKFASDMIARHRAEVGACQNRLEHAYNTNTNTSENTDAAESRIRDADMAAEVMRSSKENILAQAGVSMMAQANQINRTVLDLLK